MTGLALPSANHCVCAAFLLQAWLLCLDVCRHHRHISVARTDSPRQLKHFVEEKNPSQASLRARFWLIVALYEAPLSSLPALLSATYYISA
ncbi:hypothetical protein CHLRE_13g583787v5 [Chlamydomonas reinhardtii]|uniref:Secreted protein n=1 Tax=Chlamydomonas reinhardtii TaxID=3055 RepID=A0A2K3D0K3_CHLRE|nr:uncharacterized protein CHLRE_13g583787v5 [Chlamydomonas reinhardtii]PNW74061.1 hypothetical protein CHLRE_13g583787v5 [Chlamydomonas reinhardtii]